MKPQPLRFLPFLAFLFVAAAPLIPAQAQSQNLYDWAWVSRLGATALPGQGQSVVPPSFSGLTESLAADATGNVFIAGAYNADFIFDGPLPYYQAASGPLGPLLNSYVAKYTPSGVLAWSLNLTSNSDVGVTDLALDAAGNAYVVGSYYQQLRINGTVVTLASTGRSFFLAKISPAGVPAWTTTIEPDAASATSSALTLSRLAVDALGNSVVQGEFTAAVTINGATFAGASNRSHVLLVRHDAQGTPAGSFAGYTVQGTTLERGFTGVALASTGDVYLGGYVKPAATLQFGSLPAVTGPTAGNAAGFVVKVAANNTAAWAVKTTGPGSQSVDDLAIGPQDRCYAVGGLVGSSMGLNTQALGTGNAAGATAKDIFLARIAPSGAVESLVGGGRTNKVWGLSIGPQGEASFCTAGGLTWGNVRLPGAAWPTASLTGLVQLDATGVPQRGWQAGIGFYAAAMAVDGLNRPVLAGTYGGPSPFGFGTQQRTSPYAWNTLIARTAATVLASRAAAEVAGLEVYPNPARAVVAVRTAQGGPATVELLDALGRRVRAQRLGAGQTQVDVAGLAPGAYTLRVQQGAARSYRRLVVAP